MKPHLLLLLLLAIPPLISNILACENAEKSDSAAAIPAAAASVEKSDTAPLKESVTPAALPAKAPPPKGPSSNTALKAWFIM